MQGKLRFIAAGSHFHQINLADPAADQRIYSHSASNDDNLQQKTIRADVGLVKLLEARFYD